MVRKLSLCYCLPGNTRHWFYGLCRTGFGNDLFRQIQHLSTSMPPWKAVPPCMCSGFIKMPAHRMLGQHDRTQLQIQETLSLAGRP